MTDEEVNRLLDKAERTNARRDAMDKKNGFSTPSECPTDITIRTVISALECGMYTDDWNCVAEAAVLLFDLTGVNRNRRRYPRYAKTGE